MEITGRLTANAQVRETKNSSKVLGFTVAINDSYRTKDKERKNITTYVDCSYWLNAGIAEFLKKGTLVELYGRMGANAWVNKDGDAKSSLTCNISNVKFLGGSSNSTASNQGGNNGKGASEEDDLPF